jgi:hypothetical protein
MPPARHTTAVGEQSSAADRHVIGVQSPAALTADIDRIGDSGPAKHQMHAPHAAHILDAGLSSQGTPHPAGTS